MPALRRRAVEVATTTCGRVAAAACRQQRHNLIVIREPVSELSLDDLLAEIRGPESLSSDAFVQVVTGPGRVEELAYLAGRGLSICSATDFGGLISTISRVILGIAPRVDRRLMVELTLRLDGGSLSRFCQAVNVSATGMLIHTHDMIPVGETVDIVLSTPGCTQPVRMTAKVVRHTGGREVGGFAVEMTSFQGSSQVVWREYLRQEIEKDDTQPVRRRAAG